LFISPSVDAGVVLPPLDARDQLFAHFAFHRAAGQQVLGAVDLGRLAQDGGAAVRHQQVHRGAQRRVGADAAVAVRAAALQADGDVRRAAGFALHRIGLRQHLLDQRNAFFHRLACAAGVLDVEDLAGFAFAQAAVGQPGVDLVGLAAQAHHQHAPEVGMGGIAGQRALQDLHAHALGVHAAAGAVGQRHHAVDMG
jgi:hypothetical protein